jgi:hypothetical protein
LDFDDFEAFEVFEVSAATWTDSIPTLRRKTRIAMQYLRAILSPLP